MPKLGLPLNTRSPPVTVPAAVRVPALRSSAGALPLLELLVVMTLWDTVRSPVRVLTDTVLVELMPLYGVPPTVTWPMVRAWLLATFRAPTPEPEAMRAKVLLTLLRFFVPAPKNTKP